MRWAAWNYRGRRFLSFPERPLHVPWTVGASLVLNKSKPLPTFATSPYHCIVPAQWGLDGYKDVSLPPPFKALCNFSLPLHCSCIVGSVWIQRRLTLPHPRQIYCNKNLPVSWKAPATTSGRSNGLDPGVRLQPCQGKPPGLSLLVRQKIWNNFK